MDSAQSLNEGSSRRPLADELPKMDRSKLRGFERIAVPVCDTINTTLWLKGFLQLFVRYVTATWIFELSRPRLVLDGFDQLDDLDPPKGIILVSNHRSLFDMYVCCAVLYKKSRLLSRLHFPVRSNFFYTNPVGMLINMMVSACAMWPPVFRDGRRTSLNLVGLDQVGYILGKPGSVLGYHPEGTRSKNPDPYVFLAPKKGIARILDRCDPDTVVLPFFIVGLSNSMGDQVRAWLRPRRGVNDIRLRFGSPVPALTFQNNQSKVEVAESVMDLVRELAEQDRSRYAP